MVASIHLSKEYPIIFTCYFLLLLPHGSDSADLDASLDRGPSPLSATRALSLSCSCKPLGDAGAFPPVPEATAFQLYPPWESPLPNLIGENPDCPSFSAVGELGSGTCRISAKVLLISFSSSLMLCTFMTATHSSLTRQPRSSTSAHLLHTGRPSSTAQAQWGAPGMLCSLRPAERCPPSGGK